ncbi:hypothetical protein KPP23_043 [Pseudomonas phage KPP23]|nr:hypothetical protein KPP23_043 [Pseudomonas phage KPP23]
MSKFKAPTECACGCKKLFWFTENMITSGVQQGRLRTSDIDCKFILGCPECSATLAIVSADDFADRESERMNSEVFELTEAERGVIQERRRQVSEEGFTLTHDLIHDPGTLAAGAAAYMLHAADQLHPYSQGDGGSEPPSCWPWSPEWWRCGGGPRRALEKAVALGLAELERIDSVAQAGDGAEALRVELAKGLDTLHKKDPLDVFLADVRAEVLRAREKFPGDRIMLLALAEEFGELIKASLDEPSANVRKEAMQTAAVACRVILDGDGSVESWRAEKGLDPLLGKGGAE